MPRRLTTGVLALAAVIVGVDQATKAWATSSLSTGRSVAILGDLLSLRLTYNSGAAFSIGTRFTWVITVVTAAALLVGLYVARRVRSRVWAVALGLLLGGATTHLLDRLCRQPGIGRGHVVDFIDYAGFFVGNVADIALVTGAALWALLSLRGIQPDGRRTPGHEKRPR